MIVLANHKGGVTKTTSTANLGAMLAERGWRVLMMDCDPQANLSEAFGWTEDVVGERLEDLLAEPARRRPGISRRWRCCPMWAVARWRELLRMIPCTDALADVAADLPSAVGDGYELRLRGSSTRSARRLISCCWTRRRGWGTCRGWRCSRRMAVDSGVGGRSRCPWGGEAV